MNNPSYKDFNEYSYEIINGKIYAMTQPNIQHIRITKNIFRQFDRYLDGKQCEAFSDSLAVFYDETNRKNYVIPDVMIICNRDIIRFNGAYGPPDLIVEVLSSSTAQNDRTLKKDIYEKIGVKEYWIVDINNRLVEVYLNKDGRFETDRFYLYLTDEEIAENALLPVDDRNKVDYIDSIKVSLYDDLYIKLKDIFNNVYWI